MREREREREKERETKTKHTETLARMLKRTKTHRDAFARAPHARTRIPTYMHSHQRRNTHVRMTKSPAPSSGACTTSIN